MITYTSQAQKLRDEYLARVRDTFRGSKTVDSEELVRDIAEHIERELESAPQPISEENMKSVLERLGDPQQWGGEGEQAANAPASATEEKLSRKLAAGAGGTLLMDVGFGSIVVNGGASDEVVVDVWRKVGGKGAGDKHHFSHRFHFPFPFPLPKVSGFVGDDFASVDFDKDKFKEMFRSAGKKMKVKMGKGRHIELDFGAEEGGAECSEADAQAFFAKHPVAIEQRGKTIAIEASGGGWRGRKEAKYVVSVPTEFNVRLETAGGSIEVNDIAGDVDAETSGGELRFSRVNGPIDGETSGGNVHISDCAGSVEVETSGGGIEVAGGSGKLEGETSGGPVNVKGFQGSVSVETSGAGITLENVTGQIDGETSGGGISLVFAASPAGDVTLETSGGGITMRVPENAGFELDAETSGGSVNCELPIAAGGHVGRSHLKGTVGGGGKSVRLETSGGSIHVKKL